MTAQPNIGPKQRSIRRAIGAVAALVAAVSTIPIVGGKVDPAWMWALSPLFFVAILNGQQARTGT